MSPLVNIAARGWIGTGDNVLIGGFIIRGSAPVKILVRATGPSLSTLGVTGAVSDTMLELYQGATVIAMNDDWKSAQQSELQATGYPPTNDKESAILVTLAPGAYTTIVRGKAAGTGVGLVEALLMQ